MQTPLSVRPLEGAYGMGRDNSGTRPQSATCVAALSPRDEFADKAVTLSNYITETSTQLAQFIII